VTKKERRELKAIETLLYEAVHSFNHPIKGLQRLNEAYIRLRDMFLTNHRCTRCGKPRAAWKQRLCRWCKGVETVNRDWETYWSKKEVHGIVDHDFDDFRT
jgi:hypothetical protein